MIVYKIVKLIGKPIFKVLYRPTIINIPNLPKDKPIILCGNHTSNLDCALIIVSMKQPVYFLAKDSLHKGFKRHFFKSMGTIPVNRKEKNPNAINEAIKVLNNNQIIGIFPEGTINKTKDIIMPFKYGAVSLASKTNAYIIPFAITKKYKPFKKSITICFDKPYQITTNNLEKENKILMEKVTKLLLKNK